jgi:putative transposase
MERYRRLSLNDLVTFEGREWRVAGIEGAVVTLDGHGFFGRRSLYASSVLMNDIAITGRVSQQQIPQRTLREIGYHGTDVEKKALVWMDAVSLITTGRKADAADGEPIEPGFEQHLPLSKLVENAEDYLRRHGIQQCSRATIYRKLQDFAENSTMLVFVDGRLLRQRKARSPKDEYLREKMREVVVARKPGSTTTKKYLIGEVKKLIKPENDAFDFPSRPKLYRFLDEVMAEEGWAGTAKQRTAGSKKPKTAYGLISANRPGEFVHADSTKLDCYMLDERGQACRYELSILVDVFSTYVLGFSLVKSPTASDICRLLARASFVPATRPMRGTAEAIAAAELAPRQLIESASGDEPAPFVCIETLVIDNGSIYIAKATKQICLELGISLRYSRTYTPEDKAKVERAMRTIEQGLMQYVPGFLASSPDHRGEEPTLAAEGLLHRVVVVELLTEWFEKVWSNNPSKGLRDPLNRNVSLSPRQVLVTAAAVSPSLAVPLVGPAYISLLPSAYRKIQHYGIDHENMVFDSPEIAPYRRKRSPDPRGDGDWLVKWDPDYPLVLWVYDYSERDWIMCVWKRAGDFDRPFSVEIRRSAGGEPLVRVTDTDEATRTLVDKYRSRLKHPDPAPTKRKARKLRTRPRSKPALEISSEGIRLLGGDEEIEM